MTALYAVFGLLWIWLGDRALVWLGLTDDDGFVAAAGKGTVFIAVAAVLLYWLVRREVAKLRVSESLLRAVVEGTTDAVFVKDPDGNYLLFNEAAARFVGKPVEAVLGRDDTNLFDPAGARLVMLRDQRVMTSGITETEEETVTADGVTRTYLATKAPYIGFDGRTMELIGISRDVTERKRAEVELRSAEQRFRELADAIPQIVWTAAPDGGLTYLNAKTMEYSGVATDDLKGWSWEAIIHPDDLPNTVAEWKRILSSGEPADVEFRIRRRDGEHRWHVSRQTPSRDITGLIVAWFGTCTDIEEIRRAEAALKVRTDLYYMLARTNRATSRCSVAAELFQELCQIALETGRFLFVWVGLVDGDRVRPVARAGNDSGYLDEITITIAPDDARSQGPTGRAMVLGETVVVNDFLATAITSPWHFSGQRVGIAASAAFPLFERGQVVAVFTLYAPTPGFFTEELIATLKEITPNVSFALDAMAQERERVAAQASLQVSEARYRTLFESSGDGIFLLDFEGRIRSVNRSGAQAHGYTVDELLAMRMQEIDLPDSAEKLPMRMSRLQRGESLTFEVTHRRKDGTIFPVEVSAAPVEIGGEQLVLAFDRDITERKRAEEALRVSEERLRLALTAGQMGTFDWDLATNAIIWSATHYELLGYPIADRFPVEYRHFADRIHPEDLPAVEGAIQQALATEEEYRNEARVLFPDGTIRWIMAAGEFQYVERQAVRMLGCVVDITARKQAELELRASEERLQEVARVAGVGVFEHDHRTDSFFWSPRLREIYWFDADAPADLNAYFDMILPADQNAVASAVRRAHDPTGDGRFDVKHRLVRPTDGQIRWLAIQSQTVFAGVGPDRRLVRTVGAALDVTEARLAADALRVSEARYRQLVDLLPTAIFVHADNEILYVNPAFLRLMGATEEEELIGRSPFAFKHPESHDIVRRRHKEMARTGEAGSGFEMRLMRSDGSVVPVYSVAAPIAGFGRPAIVVAVTDLSEQERSNALLRSVLDSVNDSILTIDERGQVISANPATIHQFGYAEDEMMNQNVNMLMPELDLQEHGDDITNLLRPEIVKEIGIGHEVEGRRRDGSQFPAELTVTEFYLDGRRHFTGVLRDITERKRLEAQFLQSQKMEAVGRLAGGVAHDFNNLLTVINGYGEMVLSDLPDANPHRESVVAIREAGERAARLTQQLLAFSRKAIVEPKVLDLRVMVEESAKLLRRLIGEDIVLTVISDPQPVHVRVDPGQFEQVIMNLVVNARDAMPTGGRMKIETRIVSSTMDESTPFACLSVSDTGQGMTEETKSRLFEPFFTTKGVGKGTGLGLAVVHGVVTQSGGQLSVESTLGVGTTFEMFLPLVAKQADRVDVETTRLATRGTETVLLVEDEDAVRTIARISLESQNYTVLEADGGAEALRLAETHPGEIHLLVSDVVMPEMGGRQLLEAVRRFRPNVIVLFMSGYTDDAVILHGVLEATDAFIQKPFTPLSLARKVREVLDVPTK